jgi:hypothetical protein
MIRTAIIAGGLLGLGIFTAAPAMAGPGMDVSCSPPAICPTQATATPPTPGLITTWQQGLANVGQVWATGPATVAQVWATGPATAIGVWQNALVGPPPTTAATTPKSPAPRKFRAR